MPDTSLITLAVAAATFVVLIGMERLRPHSPAPLVAVGGGIAASWFLGLQALGVSTVGLIPQGFPRSRCRTSRWSSSCCLARSGSR